MKTLRYVLFFFILGYIITYWLGVGIYSFINWDIPSLLFHEWTHGTRATFLWVGLWIGVVLNIFYFGIHEGHKKWNKGRQR